MTSMSLTALRALGVVGQAHYAWVITKDCIDCDLVGTIGPSTCPEELAAEGGKAIRQHENADKFRLLDDDGEIYCYGYFLDYASPDDEDQPSGFEPLDDFGTASLGAVTIQYKSKATGEYETL
jgi:hypothetical protein